LHQLTGERIQLHFFLQADNTYSDSYSYPNADAYRNCNSDADANSKRNTAATAAPNTKASTTTASKANATVKEITRNDWLEWLAGSAVNRIREDPECEQVNGARFRCF
jgi:hypothetical protein